MKKLLAVFLALMMILSVSLMACSDKKEKEPADDEEENEFLPSKDTTGTTEANQEEDPEGTRAPITSSWVTATGTIYVRANDVRVRSSKSTTSTQNVKGTAMFGDSLQYTGYDNDWYEVTFKNEKAYISATFVSENQDTVIFEEHATLKEGTAIKVAADKKCNLRTDPVAAASTLKGSIDATKTANGELTIVKISKTGKWLEVRFNGTDIEKHTYDGTEKLYCTWEVIAELMGSSSGGGHG
ncbi:MAG: hypothetical protein E7670_01550 [Ruminococcaceae bacterium]|nr:hypothetical protein [Oscillospiraceae bacterium]